MRNFTKKIFVKIDIEKFFNLKKRKIKKKTYKK